MRPVCMFLAVAVGPMVMAGESGPHLKLLGTLEGGRPGPYSTIAFSPDGKTLAATDYDLDDGVFVIKLWDVHKRKVIATFGRYAFGVTSVVFSPDGKTLATGGCEKDDEMRVRLWEVASGKERASFKAHSGYHCPLAFSPDGKTLAVGGTEAGKTGMVGGRVDHLGVKLWDLSTLKEKPALKGHAGPVLAVAFSPDGTLIASAGGGFASNGQPGAGEVKLWDAAKGKVKATLKDRMAVVWSVAFSPDSKTLASADVFGNVLLWDARSGKRTATLQAFNRQGKYEDINGAYCVAFSPDGKTVAAGTVQGIKLWDVKSGKSIGPVKPAATTWAVAFSSDGKTVASAGNERVIGLRDRAEEDPTLRLWEVLPSRKPEK